MATLPDRFHLPTSPATPAANQIVGEHYRITVLTDRLLRLEYSPSGRFEDRPTQMALNRDLGPVRFRVVEDATGLHLFTDSLQLDYNLRPFSASGLSVTLTGGFAHRSQWRYGVTGTWGRQGNLGGTARTLDLVDGACPLEDGIVSDDGFAVLDDSSTLAIGADGWVEPRIEGNCDLYFFGYGHDPASAVRDFYRLTGPQPMLPRFALGNWWSRYYRYTAAEYQALIERFEAERLPFSVAVLDMDWHWVDIDPVHGSGWTGYSWNTDLFPDPPAFLAWLHDHGLKVSLNVHPAEGVRAFEDRYPEMAAAVGIDPATRLPVNFDIASVDFLLPYLEQLHHPMEAEGVDFWWLDWQQGSHTSMPGLDPLWMLNHYHFLDNSRTGRRPLTFSRYAGPGSHRYPVGFSGDTVNSWESLAFQPYFTATAANIGYGWWSHDIGGHMWGYRDDELVTRWFQFGVFSPINRLHSTDNVFAGKEPWKYDPVSRAVMGDFLRLRHRLLPYLYTMNERAHRLAEPLLRPLYYADYRPETLASRNAYLFGSELLVAAITSPVDRATGLASVRTWLPAGEWIDFFTGLRYSGARLVTLHRPIEGYPVLAKAGAILPLTGEGRVGDREPGRPGGARVRRRGRRVRPVRGRRRGRPTFGGHPDQLRPCGGCRGHRPGAGRAGRGAGRAQVPRGRPRPGRRGRRIRGDHRPARDRDRGPERGGHRRGRRDPAHRRPAPQRQPGRGADLRSAGPGAGGLCPQGRRVGRAPGRDHGPAAGGGAGGAGSPASARRCPHRTATGRRVRRPVSAQRP